MSPGCCAYWDSSSDGEYGKSVYERTQDEMFRRARERARAALAGYDVSNVLGRGAVPG